MLQNAQLEGMLIINTSFICWPQNNLPTQCSFSIILY